MQPNCIYFSFQSDGPNPYQMMAKSKFDICQAIINFSLIPVVRSRPFHQTMIGSFSSIQANSSCFEMPYNPISFAKRIVPRITKIQKDSSKAPWSLIPDSNKNLVVDGNGENSTNLLYNHMIIVVKLEMKVLAKITMPSNSCREVKKSSSVHPNSRDSVSKSSIITTSCKMENICPLMFRQSIHFNIKFYSVVLSPMEENLRDFVTPSNVNRLINVKGLISALKNNMQINKC